jgi:NAD(P)H-nitrite reductase large subunit
MCHCRVVTTAQVDRAVVAGCHSPREVSRETTASTSCGTCRPDVEAWIRFRCEAR